jgi:hypothetical protein
MTSEFPSHQPNPQEIGHSDMTGTDIEALQDGIRQLAGNIVRISETGDPTAVKEYLSDVLADTDKQVPASERKAAFEFLAGEQRAEIRQGLVNSGEQMLGNLGNNSKVAQQRLEQTATTANRSLQMGVQSHEQEVGLHFRSFTPINTRRVARGHEIAEQTVRRGFNDVTNHAEVLSVWASTQQQETQKFDGDFKKAQAHERALTEASNTVNPEYTGEQKDLSRVIDEKVKAVGATKLQSAVAEALATDQSPEDAVLALMTQNSDTMTPKIISELRTFAEQYVSLATAGSRKVVDMTKESKQLMVRFTTRGRDGYQDVRNPEDAAGLYRQQKQTLDDAVKRADFAIRQSTTIFGTSDQALQRMRQKLNVAKAVPLST